MRREGGVVFPGFVDLQVNGGGGVMFNDATDVADLMVADLIAGEIPEEWLRETARAYLSDEEKAKIDALGGFDKLMETLRERLKEQQCRHQGDWVSFLQ